MMAFAFLNDVPFQAEPHDVQWDFQMRVREQKTVGGKVVQILGTTLGDMTITGRFGYGTKADDYQVWPEQIRFRDRIVKAVRRAERQFDAKPLRFRYTPRNWDFNVFVKAMSETQFTNEDIAPTWTLTCVVDEEDAGYLVKGITDLYINRLMKDTGWKQTDYNGPTEAYLTGLLSGRTVGEYLADLAQEAFDSGLPGGAIGLSGTASAGPATGETTPPAQGPGLGGAG